MHKKKYSKVFSTGNDTNKTTHDLPEKYSIMLSERGKNIYTAVRNKQILPKDCDNQKFVIWNHYPCVYEYLY